jgi:hypothetical protein
MHKSNGSKLAVVALAALCGSGAYAGTLTADFSAPLGLKDVEFTWTYNGGEARDERTALIQGDRTDSAGPGVDGFVGSSFEAYCVEIGQTIQVPKNHTYADVVPLGFSTTDTGGATGPIFFDATRTLAMENLYGTFASSVTDKTEAAAFQLAVWEIAFDDDLNLAASGGDMYVTATQYASNIAAVDLAADWLLQVKTGQDIFGQPISLTRQSLYLLTDPDRQDLIAPGGFYPPVPEPASMLALAAGIGALAARRRRRK